MSKLFVLDKPIFIIVINLFILIFGISALLKLPIREFPQIEPSVISILTSYPGATANIVENFITTPLEGALASVNGVDFISSTSYNGGSKISLQFNLGKTINNALQETVNSISQIKKNLPPEAYDPIVSEKDQNAKPIAYIMVTNNKNNYALHNMELTDYTNRIIKPYFESLDGVSEAQIFGGSEYTMLLELDPSKMQAHDITAEEVLNNLKNNNTQATLGSFLSKNQEIQLTSSNANITNADEFNRLALKTYANSIVSVSQIGQAKLGIPENQVSVNFDGNKSSLLIGIVPQSASNPLLLSELIKSTIEKIKNSIRDNYDIKLVFDTANYIKISIKEMEKTVYISVFLVMLIMFIFLKSIKITLIPMTTIPLSIIGVCCLMLPLGFSINVLTLLAFVMAVGLVVDDAIVVIENIHRHMEDGLNSREATIIGYREIVFAVIAMTITLASVYAPIGLMQDMTGRLFREFAFALAFSVIISGFTALTLIPCLTERLMRNTKLNKQNISSLTLENQHIVPIEGSENVEKSNKQGKLFEAMVIKYKILLRKLIIHKKSMFITVIMIILSGFYCYKAIHAELIPAEDQGFLFVAFNGPENANVKYMSTYADQLIKFGKEINDVKDTFVIDGDSDSTFGILSLKDWSVRSKSADQIAMEIMPKLMSLTGVLAYAINPPALPGISSMTQINWIIKTIDSYDALNLNTQKLLDTIKKENSNFLNLRTDLEMNSEQINVKINRLKAYSLGLQISSINQAINLLYGYPIIGYFEMHGNSYPVTSSIKTKNQFDIFSSINSIPIRAKNNEMIALSSVVDPEISYAPSVLNHFQQMRSSIISANLTKNYSLGEALNYLKNVSQRVLPKNMQTDTRGQLRKYLESGKTMLTTFIFALICIYLVLSAQFESFISPLIVLSVVPISITGALFAMFYAGDTLNVYTEIGLITLVGLISKHGILIVTFAEKLEKEGMNCVEAIIEAASIRMRPILMTTGTMILGAVPLMLATGAGSESRRQIGDVIVSGMAFGTIMTLIVLPSVYCFFRGNFHLKITK